MEGWVYKSQDCRQAPGAGTEAGGRFSLRVSRRNLSCWHLDFRLLDSWTVRKCISVVFKPLSLWYFIMAALGNWCRELTHVLVKWEVGKQHGWENNNETSLGLGKRLRSLVVPKTSGHFPDIVSRRRCLLPQKSCFLIVWKTCSYFESIVPFLWKYWKYVAPQEVLPLSFTSLAFQYWHFCLQLLWEACTWGQPPRHLSLPGCLTSLLWNEKK